MGRFSEIKIDWSPFKTCAPGEKPPYPRALSTTEGLGDRLRFVAFAEKQAVHAFSGAAEIFSDANDAVKEVWLKLAQEEKKHLGWLLDRMKELNVDVAERPLSLSLWYSFDRCTTAKEFAIFMANAEERGREAGETFFETLLKVDKVTAEIFLRIATEEREHIKLAQSIFEKL